MVSTDEGSNGNVRPRWNELPSLTGPSLPKVAVGATLLTVTVPVYSVTPLSLSRILPLTERVPLSLVGQVALAVGPEGAVARAVTAVEGVGEAGRGVDRRGIERQRQAQVERAALVDRAVVAEGRGGRHVVDRDRARVLGDPVVLVADLALDRASAVVVGRQLALAVAPKAP